MTEFGEPPHRLVVNLLAQRSADKVCLLCLTSDRPRHRVSIHGDGWDRFIEDLLACCRPHSSRTCRVKTRCGYLGKLLGTDGFNSSLWNLDATSTLEVTSRLLRDAVGFLQLFKRTLKLKRGVFSLNVLGNDAIYLDLGFDLLANKLVVIILKTAKTSNFNLCIDLGDCTQDLKRITHTSLRKTINKDRSVCILKVSNDLLGKTLLCIRGRLARLVLDELGYVSIRSHALGFFGRDKSTTERAAHIFNVYSNIRRNCTSSNPGNV